MAEPNASGRGPANRRRPKATENRTARIKEPGPGLRRGDESCPNAVPELATRHDNPPAMAKPSRQLSLLQRRGARGRRELSRRCLSPPGRVSTRPAGRGWSEGTGESRRCGRGALFVTFSSPQESHSPAGARPGQSPPTESPQKPNGKDQSPGPRPAPGATNRYRCRARDGGTTARRQWRSRAGSASLLQRRVQPADRRGIVASMSGPPGRVSTRPAGRRWSEGTGESRRCGRGALVTFSSPQESHSPAGARPGQSPPTESPQKKTAKIKSPGPPACAGAT